MKNQYAQLHSVDEIGISVKYVFAYISNCPRLTERQFFSVHNEGLENQTTLKEKLYTLKQGKARNPHLAAGLYTIKISRSSVTNHVEKLRLLATISLWTGSWS